LGGPETPPPPVRPVKPASSNSGATWSSRGWPWTAYRRPSSSLASRRSLHPWRDLHRRTSRRSSTA
jgi:hypothetical protein